MKKIITLLAFGSIFITNPANAENIGNSVFPYWTNQTNNFGTSFNTKSLFIDSSSESKQGLVLKAYDDVLSHIKNGDKILPKELIVQIRNAYPLLGTNEEVIKKAQSIISEYEKSDKYGGPLFINTSTKSGVLLSKINGKSDDVNYFMYDLQQAMFDITYTPGNVNKFAEQLKGFKFLTSDYFPGKCGNFSESKKSYKVEIHVSNKKYWGAPIMVSDLEARRPTGYYVAPGSIVTIEFPEDMVGRGFSVLVGSHTWDLISKKRPTLKRLGRVTQVYPIDSNKVEIITPIGGGIYIQVPYNIDLGVREITINNAIPSPFFSYKKSKKMDKEEWLKQRENPAPWADFESDNIMLNIPKDWIYKFDNAEECMENWEKTAYAIKQLRGLYDKETKEPLTLNKTLLYLQVDVQMRGNANYPGYPQTNDTYDPNIDYKGNNSSSYFLIGGAKTPKSNTALHEMGHASSITKFRGETEALVNFLFVSAANREFGYSMDEALAYSFGTNKNYGFKETARNWIVTKEFVNGDDMSYIYSQAKELGNQMGYQQRGYAKYAEIANLFGWEVLDEFWYNENVSYENRGYFPANVNDDPVNYRIFRMSKAAGCDLRPLIHFWGIKPARNYPNDKIPTPEILADSLKNADLKPSQKIYERLVYYRDSVVPSNLAEFRKHANVFYPSSPNMNAVMGKGSSAKPDFNQRYYAKLYYGGYTPEYANSIRMQIQNIIKLYFPDAPDWKPETPSEDLLLDITTVEDWNKFAYEVAEGNTYIGTTVRLTNDIVFNENLLNADGTLSKNPVRCEPIGTATNPFEGEFDGANHIISGFYLSDTLREANGIFSIVTNGGHVKNLKVKDSYIEGKNKVGGIFGQLGMYTMVENCSFKGIVKGSSNVGGIAGISSADNISNCSVEGNVIGESNYVGGLVGRLLGNSSKFVFPKITNSYNQASVITQEGNVGGIAGFLPKVSDVSNSGIYKSYNSGIVNGGDISGAIVGSTQTDRIDDTYYLEGSCDKPAGETKGLVIASLKCNESKFSSGEIAYLLQKAQKDQNVNVWGQKIGDDRYPILGGEKVYLKDGKYMNAPTSNGVLPTNSCKIYSGTGYIMFEPAVPVDITVLNISGKLCKKLNNCCTKEQIYVESLGIYLVKIDDEIFKVLVK